MGTVVFDDSVQVRGTLSATQFSPPASSIGNAAIKSGDYVAASKLEHQFAVSNQLFAPAAAVTAVTRLIHIVRSVTGEIVGIEAIITTQATGGDRTVTVDLQKSTAAGAFATVLSATVNITNATVIRTPVAGTINSPNTVDGDILQLVVTVAGAAGNQAEGLLVTVTLREDPA